MKKDKILEAYEEVLNEQVNPKDKTGEREGFVNMVASRAVVLAKWGVISQAERKKVATAIKEIIKF